MPSPIVGQGILPSGQIAAELTNITRRGFSESLVDQFRQYSPLLAAFIDNAQFCTGGIDPITQPVQGMSLTTAQTIGYDGSFNQPSETQGIFNAQFTLAGVCVPIGFYGAEAAIQMDFTIVNRLMAKLNDASNSLSQFLGNALYNNITDTTNVLGLPISVDDGTNGDVYAGLSRTQNPWFKSYVRNAGSVAPTRQLLSQYLIGASKNAGGEMPNLAVTGPATWASLIPDFLPLERYTQLRGQGYQNAEQGVESSFRAIEVMGVPVTFDVYCPEGTFYFLNTKYIGLHVHQNAAFDLSEFQSMLGNFVLGYVALSLAYLQLVNVKPS